MSVRRAAMSTLLAWTAFGDPDPATVTSVDPAILDRHGGKIGYLTTLDTLAGTWRLRAQLAAEFPRWQPDGQRAMQFVVVAREPDPLTAGHVCWESGGHAATDTYSEPSDADIYRGIDHVRFPIRMRWHNDGWLIATDLIETLLRAFASDTDDGRG
jgi:hypothetical protein